MLINKLNKISGISISEERVDTWTEVPITPLNEEIDLQELKKVHRQLYETEENIINNTWETEESGQKEKEE